LLDIKIDLRIKIKAFTEKGGGAMGDSASGRGSLVAIMKKEGGAPGG